MIFQSYDARKKINCETDIRNAEMQTIHIFVQTWVPDYLVRILKDPNFSYELFEWNKIIKLSMVVGSPFRCYQALTNSQLDGLLCLSLESHKLKIEFIATAPWNYYTVGKMRRIGSGMIYFAIKRGIYAGGKGDFYLNALPDAENFYQKIGMVKTGQINQVNLNEYYMPVKEASSYLKTFKKYVIQE